MFTKKNLLALTIALCGLFSSASAQAEVITLIDGSKVFGKIVHYYDGTLTIRSSGDVDLKLPVQKVKSIRFKLPKPDPAFSTPKKTFKRYQKALIKGDIKTLISCFALQYQTMMMHQLGSMSLKELNAMRQAVKATKFEIKSTQYKKNIAFLAVAQTQGNTTVRAKLQFVKENGEWKMVPGQGPMPGGAKRGGPAKERRRR